MCPLCLFCFQLFFSQWCSCFRFRFFLFLELMVRWVLLNQLKKLGGGVGKGFCCHVKVMKIQKQCRRFVVLWEFTGSYFRKCLQCFNISKATLFRNRFKKLSSKVQTEKMNHKCRVLMVASEEGKGQGKRSGEIVLNHEKVLLWWVADFTKCIGICLSSPRPTRHSFSLISGFRRR